MGVVITGRQRRRATAVLAVVAVAASAGAGQLLRNGAARAAPAGSSDCTIGLTDRVAAARPGDTVTVPACVYRERVVVDKPVTLIGSPGAEIRGSDVWTAWSRAGGSWVSGQQVPAFSRHGQCLASAGERCQWPEQVFVNGQPQAQVASSTPGPGQFSVDGDRHVHLGNDPAGVLVEVTTRDAWLVGGADGVTVRGFTMRHAGNPAQQGALTPNGHSGWVVQSNVLSDAHGAVVSLGDGHGNQLLDNDISRGGDLGVHSGEGSGAVVRGNRIHHNNTEGFDAAWEAGGLKMAVVTDLTLEGNDVYDNAGPGLVVRNISCRNVVVRSNRVHGNEGAGIFYEISDEARIEGNTVWDNGTGGGAARAAGVMVSNSRDVTVTGNTVVDNGHGVMVFSIDRSNGSSADAALWNRVAGVEVSGNTVVMADDGTVDGRALNWFQPWGGGTLLDPPAGNRATGNAYGLPGAENPGRPWFTWGNQSLWQMADLDAAAGGDSGGYLSTAELSAAMAQTTGSPTPPAPVTRLPPAPPPTTTPSPPTSTAPTTTTPPPTTTPVTTPPVTTSPATTPPVTTPPATTSTTVAPATTPPTAVPPTTQPQPPGPTGPTAPPTTATPPTAPAPGTGTTAPGTAPATTTTTPSNGQPVPTTTPTTTPTTAPSTTTPTTGPGRPDGSWRSCWRAWLAALREFSPGGRLPWWWAFVPRLLLSQLCRA